MLISILLANWRLVAAGCGVAAFLGFGGLAMHWRADAAQAHSDLTQAHKDLKACAGRAAALEQQIKAAAIEEGKRYEKTEADHLAACRDAYDAGAKRLRDDKAVAAGRYVPRSGAGKTGR